MTVLLTNFYPEPDEARRGELRECLRRNLALPQIDAVHLFIEDGLTPEAAIDSCPDLLDPKVTLVQHGKRATFDEYFAYANRALAQRTVVLSNADIYFDESLSLTRRCGLPRAFIALARWDVQPDGTSNFFNVEFSQDVWIFQPPLRIRNCNFTPGIPGCENRIAWEARRSGLQVHNYALSIRAYHLHLTGLRRWTMSQRLRGALLHLRPKAIR